MSPSHEFLGPLELDVLRYVTDHHPLTVRQVADHFSGVSGQARTTLLTVMERLRAKGYLKRRKVEGRQHYSPTVTKSELLEQIVGTFVDDVLGGSVSPFVAYLTRSSLIDESDARKLTALLKRLEAREKENES